MRNYYLFVTGLGVFVLALVIVSFFVSGNPFEQKNFQLDEQRTNDLNNLHYAIESYYTQSVGLPTNLNQVENTSNLLDPQTHQPYEYAITSPITYSLCANFSSNSKDLKQTSSNVTYVIPPLVNNNNPFLNHPKGHFCGTYTVTSRAYQYTPPPTYNPPPAFSPTVSLPSCLSPLLAGEDISIKWLDTSINGTPYVDIGQNQSFATHFYHKEVNGLIGSTSASQFLGVDNSGQSIDSDLLTLAPNTKYFVRYFDGQYESPISSFVTPTKCSQPSPTDQNNQGFVKSDI